MSDVAIRVSGLGKRYTIGAAQRRADTLRDALTGTLKDLAGRWRRNGRHDADTTLWALRDVSFEVKRGEVLGVIGRNGAGKSTLLKILSRITEPTTGEVELRGRVGSLLEVGTGFHPELTGRENVFLNGAILGMQRREIQRKFDEIVDFAGVEQFIDTPVKRYSSGMYMRLAFAVAAHMETEILLVDEVLAVGDAEFQKRCLGKMGAVARAGKTVVFVSHNMAAMRSLTRLCVCLHKGSIVAYGMSEQIVRRYLAEVGVSKISGSALLDEYHRDDFRNSPVRFLRVWVDTDQPSGKQMGVGCDLQIFAELQTDIEIRAAHWGIGIKRTDGTHVLSQLSIDHGRNLSLSPGKHVLTCRLVKIPLTPGDYTIDIGINQSVSTTAWDVILDYPLIQVVDRDGAIRYWPDRTWGAIHWDRVEWQIAT